MTAVTSAALFRSENKDSGFHASERPQMWIHTAILNVFSIFEK